MWLHFTQQRSQVDDSPSIVTDSSWHACLSFTLFDDLFHTHHALRQLSTLLHSNLVGFNGVKFGWLRKNLVWNIELRENNTAVVDGQWDWISEKDDMWGVKSFERLCEWMLNKKKNKTTLWRLFFILVWIVTMRNWIVAQSSTRISSLTHSVQMVYSSSHRKRDSQMRSSTLVRR